MTKVLVSICASFFFLQACNELRRNPYNADSQSLATPQKDTILTLSGEDTSIQHTDTLKRQLNGRLQTVFDGKLHIITDAEAEWNKEDLNFIILPERKKNPHFPIIAIGDFNWDGREDYVALVTDCSTKMSRIAIFLDSSNVSIWDEDVKGAGIETYFSPEIKNLKGNQIVLKGAGILVQWFEASSYVIYWDGRKFTREWTGD